MRRLGSSPLTRGKLAQPGIRGQSIGLIPAHAGKTQRVPSMRCIWRAHPRSRGENLVLHRRQRSVEGSSPLTRGKPRSKATRDSDGRLIPAHAGKTDAEAGLQGCDRAHPRSRGENGTRSDLAYVTEGSSPLTRGKRRRCPRGASAARLIPAHAGKTIRPDPSTPPIPAHPRSRGENSVIVYSVPGSTGSSPLTRGKRPDSDRRLLVGRLIPAHAGKT